MQPIRHVHFIGVGGIGMSGLASILNRGGYRVSGSDANRGSMAIELENHGVDIQIGHSPENVGDADLVVVSSAINEDNPELVAATKRGIPVLKRAELLAALVEGKTTIAISGSHGKTTTTAMLGSILTAAGLDPSMIVGGIPLDSGNHAVLSKGNLAVVEADESDGSLTVLSPEHLLIANLDFEHPDFYSSIDEIYGLMKRFAIKVQEKGKIYLNVDDSWLKAMAGELNREQVRTFALKQEADITADPVLDDPTNRFRLMRGGQKLATIQLKLAGEYNIYNALAAATIALELDVSAEAIKKGLESFQGVRRRMEIKGEYNGATIIDDYAHHPTEIRALLSALTSDPNKRILTVFQPHRYSRLHYLFEGFLEAFTEAHQVLVLPVYAAFEENRFGVDGKDFVEALRAKKIACEYLDSHEACAEKLRGMAEAGDTIVTIGAGDVYRVGEMLKS